HVTGVQTCALPICLNLATRGPSSTGMGDRSMYLTNWNALASLDDEALPLLDAALLIARDEYPDLDTELYAAQVQAHADALRDEVAAIEPSALKMAAINHHLFVELAYIATRDSHCAPRNGYVAPVLDGRLGNPISLALVQMDVARRLGIPPDGVSFAAHFLVRLPVDGGLLVMDPFN